MAAWPELDELKQVLNVDSHDWDGDQDDTRLTAVLAAAIAKVKRDIGTWDEYEDEPTDSQGRAALRMAELMALRPESAENAGKDPVYRLHLQGSRKKFAVG